ncbi:hypothetical protein CMV_004963 [Castanea mollissima]|uniref:Uncharacterized protein n=1 Tax=Castanea mollissima TaxID=60419 RepID=A0A8J4RDX7_9ROSI|nr:hypothetical protein CMV_004963 [Castanea mollissima]
MVFTPTNKWATKFVLVNEIVLICRSNSFALVDVIDPNGFKNLGLNEMANTSIGHYGDRNDALDFLDERWVWHVRNASLRWLRCNETTCTNLFDDLDLFGVYDFDNGSATWHLASLLILSLQSTIWDSFRLPAHKMMGFYLRSLSPLCGAYKTCFFASSLRRRPQLSKPF